MRKENLPLAQLQVGMYVELPTSWFSHDFIKNSFLITSENQLKQLKTQKLKQVVVNYDLSQLDDLSAQHKTSEAVSLLADSDSPVKDPRSEEAPKKWASDRLMTDDLRNVLEDKNLPPDQKSAFVYSHSVSMMEQLLEFPTAENIRQSKEAIYAISDMVLSENDTAMNLLRITSHDFYTYTHSVNVGITSILLSKQLFQHSDAHDLQELAAGFFLHDLGKVNIDPLVLNKPGKLTDVEMQHIRTHPYQGYKILQQAQALSEECKVIVMQHHEAIDGSGYPRRLKDREIHLYGKICAIADVYDALTAERSYKKALSSFDALKLMKEQMISRFDKKIFGSFVKIF
jgi:HD-GYP domain-containing protein (c-di-GMP phosphodiesterase class II)